MTWTTKWKERTDAFNNKCWIRKMGGVTAKIKLNRDKFILLLLVRTTHPQCIELGKYGTLAGAKKNLPQQMRGIMVARKGQPYAKDILNALEQARLKTEVTWV